MMEMLPEEHYIAGNPAHAGSPLLTVLTGCSSSGKSSLLGELARRGYAVIPEPGRQIVKDELAIEADGVPWQNTRRFMELCLSRAMGQPAQAQPDGRPLFFDRSVIDVVAGFEPIGLPVPDEFERAAALCRYGPRVFVTPPWPEIFVNDAERPYSFEEAEAVYVDSLTTFRRLGYELLVVPQVDVVARADFVEAHLIFE